MRYATFALVPFMLVAPGLASAQSVLERVIGQIDNASNLGQVNGTYANIAESIGGAPTTETVPMDLSNAPADTVLWSTPDGTELTVADLGTTFVAGDGSDLGTWMVTNGFGGNFVLAADGSLTNNMTGVPGLVINGVFPGIILNQGATATIPDDAVVYDVGGTLRLLSDTLWSDSPDYSVTDGLAAPFSGVDFYSATDPLTVDVVTPGLSTTIDGSINNVLDGIDGSTQEALAGLVSAVEWNMPTFDFGDMATTALGAVNTGEITLGVNSAVDEASTSTTNAISAVMTQIGGSADTGALVLNVASNASAVNGSINNVIAEVNGSVGNLSTTALGAVNTGTITSGVDAAVAGIVGMSGQSGL
jgi:hypothetical protein